MTDDFNKIRRLIKKYGLVLSSYYDGTHPQSEYRDERYGFEGDCDFVSGHVIGINNTSNIIILFLSCITQKNHQNHFHSFGGYSNIPSPKGELSYYLSLRIL